MGIPEFKAITAAEIPAMAQLLMARQTLESRTFPFLLNCCLNIKYVTELLETLLTSGGAVGTGAFVEDKLVGYLAGKIKADALRGKHAWVPYEAMAVGEGQSPELIRALYARTSSAWLEQGCFTHYAIVPLGSPSCFSAFQRLGFSIQQVHGVMDLEEYRPFAQESDAEVRIADRGDREKLGRLSGIIRSYQNAAPTFEPVLPEVMTDIKAGYESTVEDGEMTILLAEQDGEELGFQIYEAAAPGLMSPDGSAELSVAGTYPCRMGMGIGKRLMNEGCALMRARGARHMIADWRITNLASSAFWPKCGFHPVSYRMVRYIDRNWSRANLL